MNYVKGKKTSDLAPNERLKFFKKAKRLHREEGLGSRKIARKLGLDGGLVHGWLYCGHDPRRGLNFVDLSPSYSLSYLVGVLLGDGSSFSHDTSAGYTKHIVNLRATDKDFVKTTRRFVQNIAFFDVPKIQVEEPRKESHSLVYELRFGSQHLFNYMKEEKYSEVLEEYPSGFLSAFCDGEAHVSKQRKQIRIYNTNKSLLDSCKELLETFDISSHYWRKPKEKNEKATKDTYALVILTEENLRKFAEKIDFHIERKRERLHSWI